MASTINSTGTSSGVATAADASGVLELQGGGNTGITIDATGVVTIAASAGVPLAVEDLAALKALTTRPEAVVVKTGQAAGAWQWVVGSATTANDGTVVACTSGTAGRYKRIYDGGVNLRWFGATGLGVADDATAINAALAAGYSLVEAYPGDTYRVASTVTIPAGVTLDLMAFAPSNPADATTIVGDATVSPVVQLGAGGNNLTVALKNGTVTRTGTNPTTTYVGIDIQDGNSVRVENVLSDNHGICWRAVGHPATGLGLGLMCINTYSSRATDAHIVNDSWAEWTWIGGRVGRNGAGDYNCSAFVRLQGGVGATSGGPNTQTFTDVVFAQGGGTGPTNFWQMVNLGTGGTPGIDAVGFNIADCHIETVTGAIFKSDSTWNSFSRFTMSCVKVNCPAVPMWDLNAATQPDLWHIIGCTLYVSTFTLAPTAAINSVSITGGFVSGTMSLTGIVGSTMSIAGLGHGGSFTLAGTWSVFSSIGEYFTVGTFINTATGAISVVSALGNTLEATTFTGDVKFTDNTYDIGKAGATRPRDGFFSRNLTLGGTATIDVGTVSTIDQLTIKNLGTSGANIKLVDVSGTPNKFLRSYLGFFEILNSAYTTALLSINESGTTTLISSITSGTVSIGGVTTIDVGTVSTTDQLTIKNLGTSGANIKLIDASGTPNKFIRAVSGSFQVLNSAYSSALLTITNAGLSTFISTVIGAASTTSAATFNVPHGTAPSSPNNGDMWTTTAGLYVRINGATVGPLS